MQIKELALENRQVMRRETKRLLSSIALAAGTLGTAFIIRKKTRGKDAANGNRWARPGMPVTFRAEVMPGRDASERTFRVEALLPSDRVRLVGVSGEHGRGEFERLR